LESSVQAGRGSATRSAYSSTNRPSPKGTTWKREIAYRLGGVRTILDAGAETGRFSIPLARQGFHVTNIDFSQA